jgi:hypothetical protein
MGLVPQDVWPPFQNATSLAPIANARALKETDVEQSTPPGLINRGPVPSNDYTRQVATSKVLLTVGRPEISPSPYLALYVLVSYTAGVNNAERLISLYSKLPGCSSCCTVLR